MVHVEYQQSEVGSKRTGILDYKVSRNKVPDPWRDALFQIGNQGSHIKVEDWGGGVCLWVQTPTKFLMLFHEGCRVWHEDYDR